MKLSEAGESIGLMRRVSRFLGGYSPEALDDTRRIVNGLNPEINVTKDDLRRSTDESTLHTVFATTTEFRIPVAALPEASPTRVVWSETQRLYNWYLACPIPRRK